MKIKIIDITNGMTEIKIPCLECIDEYLISNKYFKQMLPMKGDWICLSECAYQVERRFYNFTQEEPWIEIWVKPE